MTTFAVILISSCLLGIFFFLLGSGLSKARKNETNKRESKLNKKEKKRIIRNGWGVIMIALGVICLLSCFCAMHFNCYTVAKVFLGAGVVLALVGGLMLKFDFDIWWW